MDDQLFASFMLDEKKGLEIALNAEMVSEATPFNTSIRQLSTSIDYLEGIMPLRGDIIPVINLKKRLGLEHHDYSSKAKVAVVNLHNQRFGLLFDDIKEVFKADSESILPINRLLQDDDRIISALIKREQVERTAELLDLSHLFRDQSREILAQATKTLEQTEPTTQTTYSRWVVFRCLDQLYGVPVQYSREIAFFSEIDDTFKSGHVEGAIQLRGNTVPVLDGRFLLTGQLTKRSEASENRVLILSSDDCSFGMMVDDIQTILTIPDNTILPVPSSGSESLQGIYAQDGGTNILLLDMPTLVCKQIDEIKSLSRIKDQSTKKTDVQQNSRSHHLITENCYLIVAIGKNFAIELKDIQEIIESEEVMQIPRASGYSTAVINLRGNIVPVIDMRSFYGFPEEKSVAASKLIICRGQSRVIALGVDQIITIYKQEDYHSTPSLNPRLSDKKDTLDRLIEYEKENGMKEHVLVVNLHNLVGNHLEFRNMEDTTPQKPQEYAIEGNSATINSQGEE